MWQSLQEGTTSPTFTAKKVLSFGKLVPSVVIKGDYVSCVKLIKPMNTTKQIHHFNLWAECHFASFVCYYTQCIVFLLVQSLTKQIPLRPEVENKTHKVKDFARACVARKGKVHVHQFARYA